MAVVVVVVLAASTGVALAATRAPAAPKLPPVSAKSLIASSAAALENPPSFSGSASVNVNLGVNGLADAAQSAGVSETGPIATLELVNGQHSLRVWRSPDGLRVAELLSQGERDIIVSRTQAWRWSSTTWTARELATYPASTGARLLSPKAGLAEASGTIPDPAQIATQALAAITPSTRVWVSGTTTLAGRSAYVLSIEPRTSATLVGRVQVDVDAATRVPLSVAIYPRGSTSAAVSAAFTSVSFGAVDPSIFHFVPPAGAKVTRARPGNGTAPAPAGERSEPSLPPTRTFGKGWTTVVAVRMPSMSRLQRDGVGSDINLLFPYSGPLVSARIVNRGDHTWLVVGAVPQSALVKVQAELP